MNNKDVYPEESTKAFYEKWFKNTGRREITHEEALQTVGKLKEKYGVEKFETIINELL